GAGHPHRREALLELALPVRELTLQVAIRHSTLVVGKPDDHRRDLIALALGGGFVNRLFQIGGNLSVALPFRELIVICSDELILRYSCAILSAYSNHQYQPGREHH